MSNHPDDDDDNEIAPSFEEQVKFLRKSRKSSTTRYQKTTEFNVGKKLRKELAGSSPDQATVDKRLEAALNREAHSDIFGGSLLDSALGKRSPTARGDTDDGMIVGRPKTYVLDTPQSASREERPPSDSSKSRKEPAQKSAPQDKALDADHESESNPEQEETEDQTAADRAAPELSQDSPQDGAELEGTEFAESQCADAKPGGETASQAPPAFFDEHEQTEDNRPAAFSDEQAETEYAEAELERCGRPKPSSFFDEQEQTAYQHPAAFSDESEQTEFPEDEQAEHQQPASFFDVPDERTEYRHPAAFSDEQEQAAAEDARAISDEHKPAEHEEPKELSDVHAAVADEKPAELSQKHEAVAEEEEPAELSDKPAAVAEEPAAVAAEEPAEFSDEQAAAADEEPDEPAAHETELSEFNRRYIFLAIQFKEETGLDLIAEDEKRIEVFINAGGEIANVYSVDYSLDGLEEARVFAESLSEQYSNVLSVDFGLEFGKAGEVAVRQLEVNEEQQLVPGEPLLARAPRIDELKAIHRAIEYSWPATFQTNQQLPLRIVFLSDSLIKGEEAGAILKYLEDGRPVLFISPSLCQRGRPTEFDPEVDEFESWQVTIMREFAWKSAVDCSKFPLSAAETSALGWVPLRSPNDGCFALKTKNGLLFRPYEDAEGDEQAWAYCNQSGEYLSRAGAPAPTPERILFCSNDTMARQAEVTPVGEHFFSSEEEIVDALCCFRQGNDYRAHLASTSPILYRTAQDLDQLSIDRCYVPRNQHQGLIRSVQGALLEANEQNLNALRQFERKLIKN